MFWIAMALLILTVPLIFGSLMAVSAGAVSCTFNTTIWFGCVKTAYVILAVRIGIPALFIAGIAKVIHDIKKH